MKVSFGQINLSTQEYSTISFAIGISCSICADLVFLKVFFKSFMSRNYMKLLDVVGPIYSYFKLQIHIQRMTVN
jgi:hypothetical protein